LGGVVGVVGGGGGGGGGGGVLLRVSVLLLLQPTFVPAVGVGVTKWLCDLLTGMHATAAVSRCQIPR